MECRRATGLSATTNQQAQAISLPAHERSDRLRDRRCHFISRNVSPTLPFIESLKPPPISPRIERRGIRPLQERRLAANLKNPEHVIAAHDLSKSSLRIRLCRCTMVHSMEAEWDPAKAKTNFRRHGVRFADAVTALEDSGAISLRDERAGEERWISIGMDSLGRILVIVYTWRGERVRLISARSATRREARQYEEGI
jgi:uncharacterized protein